MVGLGITGGVALFSPKQLLTFKQQNKSQFNGSGAAVSVFYCKNKSLQTNSFIVAQTSVPWAQASENLWCGKFVGSESGLKMVKILAFLSANTNLPGWHKLQPGQEEETADRRECILHPGGGKWKFPGLFLQSCYCTEPPILLLAGSPPPSQDYCLPN